MLRLKDIPPEEMPAVVRVASELYERDQVRQAQDQERASVVAAAEELGLPPEYLERAAAELHRRRVEGIAARRQQRRVLAWAGGGAVMLVFLTGWVSLRSSNLEAPAQVATPSPPALTEGFDAGAASRWTLDKNPETDAAVTFAPQQGAGNAAVLQVRHFGSGTGTTPFFANLDMVRPSASLAGSQVVSFRVRGDGLPRVRFDIQGSPTERWRSPALPVTGSWQDVRLDLKQFERQTRASTSGAWKVQPYRAPDSVQRLSFKVGYFINDPGAHGNVAISDLRIE